MVMMMMMMMMMVMMMMMMVIHILEIFDLRNYVKPLAGSHHSKLLICLEQNYLSGDLYDILGVLKTAMKKILLIFSLKQSLRNMG